MGRLKEQSQHSMKPENRQYPPPVSVEPSDDLIQHFLGMQSRERDRDFKTPGELGRELNLTASRVRQLVEAGKLRAIRVAGRIYIYKPAAIRELISDY